MLRSVPTCDCQQQGAHEAALTRGRKDTLRSDGGAAQGSRRDAAAARDQPLPLTNVPGCDSVPEIPAPKAPSRSVPDERTWEKRCAQIAAVGESPSAKWKSAQPPIAAEDMPECKARISPTFPHGSFCWFGDNKFEFDEKANELPATQTDMTDATLALHPRCHSLLQYTPTLPQLVALNSAARGVFGMDATASLFGQADIFFLHYTLVAFPEARSIVEFGTASGTTSLWLGMAARVRGGVFHTIEYFNNDGRTAASKAAWLEQMNFVQDDLLASRGVCARRSPGELAGTCVPCSRRIAEIVSSSDYLLIDNGDKIREAGLWAKFVPVGGIALVHDNTDTQWDAPYDELFAAQGFTKIFTDIAYSVGSHLRAWRRDGPGNSGVWTLAQLDAVTDECKPYGYFG
jgi:hypothetical protein